MASRPYLGERCVVSSPHEVRFKYLGFTGVCVGVYDDKAILVFHEGSYQIKEEFYFDELKVILDVRAKRNVFR